MEKVRTLEQLNGQIVPYYGAVNCYVKLGDHIFLIKEDEDDGYRSHCKGMKVVNNCECASAFSTTPIAMVRVREVTNWALDYGDYEKNLRDFCGIILEDPFIEFQWGTFGTNQYEDYYPYFVFQVHAVPSTDDAKNLITLRDTDERGHPVPLEIYHYGREVAISRMNEANKPEFVSTIIFQMGAHMGNKLREKQQEIKEREVSNNPDWGAF